MFKVERTEAIKKDGKMGKGGKRRIEITNKEAQGSSRINFLLSYREFIYFQVLFHGSFVLYLFYPFYLYFP